MTQKAAPQPRYKRVVLKLSGEALSGQQSLGIDPTVLKRIAGDIAELASLSVEVAIVIGGGNLFRGNTMQAAGIGRITADQMGMLATVMNALALRDAFTRIGIESQVMSAIPVGSLVEPFEYRKAIHYLSAGQIIIFAAGTGNPLVTTDSAASLRCIEIQADLLMKATQVDGIYDKDPNRHQNAVKYKFLTYAEALKKELGVMDLTAFCQCRDHNVVLRVFDIGKPGVMRRIILGEDEGTLVTNGEQHD